MSRKDRGSKSKELRNVIYAIHIKKGGDKDNFQNYYDEVMSKLILKYSRLLKKI